MTIRIGSLCSGYRGLDMAVEAVFGGTTAWVSDIDPGASAILAHHWPDTPNLGDLTTTLWEDVEPVDIVCGGYPCQPFSSAGQRKGTGDERHIWPWIARALGVLRPRVAIFENVAGHLRLGFDTVLADLAALGFDAEWCTVRASEVGAPHQRNRLFILATASDAPHLGHERGGAPWGRGHGPADHGDAAPHADGVVPRDHGELPAGRDAVQGGVRADAPRCGTAPAAHADRVGRGPGEPDLRAGQPDAAWGRFAPAIRRWEHTAGRRAPWATDARNRLNPQFVEWLMGLPAGHVTDVPGLTRNQMLHALGNGVVPQQAEAAIRLLAARASAAA
ncbi:DNA cytosine methyltransferase [Streptomyces altiplanensis]